MRLILIIFVTILLTISVTYADDHEKTAEPKCPKCMKERISKLNAEIANTQQQITEERVNLNDVDDKVDTELASIERKAEKLGKEIDAIWRILEKFARNKEKDFRTLSEKELRQIAQDLGMPPEQLLNGMFESKWNEISNNFYQKHSELQKLIDSLRITRGSREQLKSAILQRIRVLDQNAEKTQKELENCEEYLETLKCAEKQMELDDANAELDEAQGALASVQEDLELTNKALGALSLENQPPDIYRRLLQTYHEQAGNTEDRATAIQNLRQRKVQQLDNKQHAREQVDTVRAKAKEAAAALDACKGENPKSPIAGKAISTNAEIGNARFDPILFIPVAIVILAVISLVLYQKKIKQKNKNR